MKFLRSVVYRRVGLAVGVGLGCVLVSSTASAQAFVQTMTCGPNGPRCKEGQEPKPVRWFNPCITYWISDNTPSYFPKPETKKSYVNSGVVHAIREGFAVWSNQPGSDLEISWAGITNGKQAGYNENGQNINVVVWEHKWPDDLPDAIAITAVNYLPSNGRIVDADIQMNTSAYHFTFGDRYVETDIQSTIAHEAGHFIGFSHCADPDATMYAS